MNNQINITGKIRLQEYSVSENIKRLIKFLRFFNMNSAINNLVIKYGVVIQDTGVLENIITNAGKAQIALLAGDAAAVPFTYLAVGTSSTAVAASDTTLGAEITTLGLGRAAATVSRTTTSVSNDTLSLVYTWTATGGTTIQEIGIFNAASSGTILGHKLTGAFTVANTNPVLGTYTVSFA